MQPLPLHWLVPGRVPRHVLSKFLSFLQARCRILRWAHWSLMTLAFPCIICILYPLFLRMRQSYILPPASFFERDNSRWQSDSIIFIMNLPLAFYAAFAESHPPPTRSVQPGTFKNSRAPVLFFLRTAPMHASRCVLVSIRVPKSQKL